MKKEININGEIYVKKSSLKTKAKVKAEAKEMVMVRTYSAGVHYGYLAKKESTLAGIEVELTNARRVWSWAGAASLSQLAMEGTSKPEKCKFPCVVTSVNLVAIEIIPMKKAAIDSLNSVGVWSE